MSLMVVGYISQGVSGLLGFLIVKPGAQFGYLLGFLVGGVATFAITYFFGYKKEKIEFIFGTSIKKDVEIKEKVVTASHSKTYKKEGLIMLDLHMHTSLSDGSLSVQELCSYLEREEIKLFSISDHNHALAYESDLPTDIPYITGTEIATSHKGRIIEIHGYMNDPKTINVWYKNFYSVKNLEKNEKTLFNRMKKTLEKENLNLSADLEMPLIEKGISKKTIYYDLIKYNEKFKQKFPTYGFFFRQALSNPNSNFFIDEGTTYPSIDQVIDLIHSAKGKAVLAHPYEYGFANTIKELDILRNKLDGIESFHPSASYRQGLTILDYCADNNLISSGGSDFHRFEKEIPVGVRLFEDLYEKQPFHWLHNYISKEDFK